MSNKTISKWETGRGIPSVDLLIPLCEVLGIELKSLLTGNSDKSYEELLVLEIKKNKKRHFINLIGGIILCLGLCVLETLLYAAGVSEEIALLIFILIVFMMIILEICLYITYKK